MKWERLDNLINGPEYSNGRLWTTFPILKFIYLGTGHPSQALRWTWNDASHKEAEVLSKFDSELLRLSGSRRPSNCVQGESMYILMFLARLIPFMGQAVMESDLARTEALIDIVRELLGSLEVLLDVEEAARERLNAEIDVEIELEGQH
jgi:hypothetical protein